MKIPKTVNKLGRYDRNGMFYLRVYRKKKTKKLDAHYLLKCGCCDSKLKIFDFDGSALGNMHKDLLEINGVMGSIAEWRRIFLPLLHLKLGRTKNGIKDMFLNSKSL